MTEAIVKHIKTEDDIHTFTLLRRNNENYDSIVNAVKAIANDKKASNMKLDKRTDNFLWVSIIDKYNRYKPEKGNLYKVRFRTFPSKNNPKYINFRFSGNITQCEKEPPLFTPEELYLK